MAIFFRHHTINGHLLITAIDHDIYVNIAYALASYFFLFDMGNATHEEEYRANILCNGRYKLKKKEESNWFHLIWNMDEILT